MRPSSLRIAPESGQKKFPNVEDSAVGAVLD